MDHLFQIIATKDDVNLRKQIIITEFHGTDFEDKRESI